MKPDIYKTIFKLFPVSLFAIRYLLFTMAYGLAPMALHGQPLPAETTSYDAIGQEIVIKSGMVFEMRTRRPPLKIKTDDFESIKKSLEPDKDLFLFESGDFVSYSRNYPEKISSSRVIAPWRTGFSDKTVITFYPRKIFEESFSRAYTGKTAKETQWTLSITDEEGKIFHKYYGTGLPPEEINWSGENDQREWLKAGHSYAPVYVFVDEYGSPKTVIGALIKFTAIVFQKGPSLNISLDSVVVFGPDKALRNIEKPGGESLLVAAADLVKRRYYGIPIKVNVYAQTKDLAEFQAELVSIFLKTELMAGENVISSEGLEDTFAQQRLDIMLLNK
ncbi:MAG: hypothetical protein A2X34_03450 [Elusimicrobia bacterium GWC2_51_8]|nr:MAG: hypothetical protein A2X33_03580 [Elusimicrobia bacterium GWA2_51_34]OGR64957.1 MAG: hypothetical protein A2X34_03450 [Elusimicrobia bacterium GWC2_51_8]OGR85274.1 MAG: hypothetical protein A2021_00800 [Elusimicrobia bacterium GWF2_52_66]HAF95781.1 hypothetical protein [Elusimicrobiota bacterium]HCE99173.1 hypothetical protein [Elusimicrobiota bacterium]